MFWLAGDGKQGFQQAPTPDSFIVKGMGAMGTVQVERKLAYFEVSLSGHMLPQFAPKVSSEYYSSSTPAWPIESILLGCVPEYGVVVRIKGEPMNVWALKCNIHPLCLYHIHIRGRTAISSIMSIFNEQ